MWCNQTRRAAIHILGFLFSCFQMADVIVIVLWFSIMSFSWHRFSRKKIKTASTFLVYAGSQTTASNLQWNTRDFLLHSWKLSAQHRYTICKCTLSVSFTLHISVVSFPLFLSQNYRSLGFICFLPIENNLNCFITPDT